LAAVVNIAADPAPATQSGEYTPVSTTRWCTNYPWLFGRLLLTKHPLQGWTHTKYTTSKVAAPIDQIHPATAFFEFNW